MEKPDMIVIRAEKGGMPQEIPFDPKETKVPGPITLEFEKEAARLAANKKPLTPAMSAQMENVLTALGRANGVFARSRVKVTMWGYKAMVPSLEIDDYNPSYVAPRNTLEALCRRGLVLALHGDGTRCGAYGDPDRIEMSPKGREVYKIIQEEQEAEEDKLHQRRQEDRDRRLNDCRHDNGKQAGVRCKKCGFWLNLDASCHNRYCKIARKSHTKT